MLVNLTIRNLALIEALETDLTQGFTALTGETGAGKSLLLDALGLLLGHRADASLVRHGEPMAEVCGLFRPYPSEALSAFLVNQDLALEDGDLLVRRQIKREGGGKVWVNGTPVPATVLASLAEFLGEIQGQHSAPSLLQPARQRDVMDGAGQLGPQLHTVATHHAAWQAAEVAHAQAKQALKLAIEHSAQNAENLAILERLNYLAGEEVTLQNQRQALQNGGQIKAVLVVADDALNAEHGALSALRTASKAMQQAAQFDAAMQLLAATLQSELLTLEDTAHQIARAAGQETEGNIDAIDDRLHALKGAARKLGCEIHELTEQWEALQKLQHGTGPLAEAEAQAAKAVATTYNTFRAACQSLSHARAEAAQSIGPQLQKALQALLLPHAQIEIRLSPLPENQWNAKGAETIEIMLAANPGSPLQPIQKVASGGELARLLLALKQVLYAQLPPQMLVLDEVDTGLSGAAASAVGAAMADLGKRHQVLAVTHHAQVAAQAAQHGNLKKSVQNGTTTTQLQWLEPAAREEELARLLAGATVTTEARAAALALLREAHHTQRAA